MTASDTLTPEVQAERERVLASAPAAGIRTEDHPRADYFGAKTWRFMLPDGVSYFEHKKLMEGDLRTYRNGSNRDVTINRGTRDARIRLAAGDDRKLLVELAVCGWDLVRDGSPVAFSDKSKATVLAAFDPDVIDGLVKDINDKNPALRADVTAQDLRDEIESLEEQLKEKEKEEAGEASSSS